MTGLQWAKLFCCLSWLTAVGFMLVRYLSARYRKRQMLVLWLLTERQRLWRGGARGMRGLELIESSKGTLRHSSIYTLLFQMERDGLLHSEVDTEDAYNRRRYMLTSKAVTTMKAHERAS